MRRRSQRGNAFIEFALAFSCLFPLMYGTFQFGLSFMVYNELANAVRAGGRYASYRTYDSSTSTPSDAYLRDVRNAVVYGKPTGGSLPVVSGLKPSMVTVQMVMLSGTPYRVRVSINNYPLRMFFGTLNLRKPSATFPYTGVYAPGA